MQDLLPLLPESLFYYCAGKDPTPILMLGARVPLYVYVDLLKGGQRTPEDEIGELHRRLTKGGYTLTETRTVPSDRQAAECSVWQDREGERFSLLYLVADATDAYFSLYGEEILPRYICNYRYEMNNSRLGPIEEKVTYILGHCHTGRHRPIGEYPYHGDYAFGRKAMVTLYEHDGDESDL